MESEFFANILHKHRWGNRFNPIWSYSRSDTNVFVLASIIYILNDLKISFNEKQFNTYIKIKDTILNIIPRYRNLEGLPTYNFYSLNPVSFFPNGYFMKHFKHFKLPDDIDDTALIWSILPKYPSDIMELKKLANQYAVDSPFGKVYNTWLSARMPPDIDICALINFLNLSLKSPEQISAIDHNSIKFLAASVKELRKDTFWLARHYGNPALVLYHYARLMSNHKLDILENLKKELIEIAYSKWSLEPNIYFKMLYETSLMKWGEKFKDPSNIQLSSSDPSFYQFIGAPLAPYNFLRPIASKKPFIIYYNSRIHELALILEHHILSEKNKC